MLNVDPKTRSLHQQDTLDRLLRLDPRLNITTRCLWLMTALSHRSGYSSMSVDRMAEQLNAKSSAAVRQARRKLVQLGMFSPRDRWRYDRVLLPNETRNSYWHRACGCRHLDLTAR